jgi:DNA-binding protein H-NS
MKPDLKSLTREELEKLSTDINKALQERIGSEKKAALAAAEKAANLYGFSLAEIVASGPKTRSIPKYANPDDKAKTWTGKGRQPDWFKTALASGKRPDDLAI